MSDDKLITLSEDRADTIGSLTPQDSVDQSLIYDGPEVKPLGGIMRLEPPELREKATIGETFSANIQLFNAPFRGA